MALLKLEYQEKYNYGICGKSSLQPLRFMPDQLLWWNVSRNAEHHHHIDAANYRIASGLLTTD